jgi:quercetin dioxygenase-like cupin family protein
MSIEIGLDPADAGFGTEENPLIHPVTGERIVFRKRARDTGGELLEMSLYLAPGGFIAAPHVHPNQEERFEVGGSAVMFRVAGKDRMYQPGEFAVVPAGVPHVVEPEPGGVRNPGPVPARARHGDVLRDLLRPGAGRQGQQTRPSEPTPGERPGPRLQPRDAAVAAGAVDPRAHHRGSCAARRALGYRARYDRYSGPSSNP